jgi:hypothetical protein
MKFRIQCEIKAYEDVLANGNGAIGYNLKNIQNAVHGYLAHISGRTRRPFEAKGSCNPS